MRSELSRLLKSNVGAIGFGFLAGIAFWDNVAISISVAMLVLLLSATGILLSLYWRWRPLLYIAIFCVGAGLGLLRFAQHESATPRGILDPLVGNEVSLSGTISSEVEAREYGSVFHLKPTVIQERVIDESRLKVLVRAELYDSFTVGELLEVRGTLLAPENFETDSGRVFDYTTYLGKDDILYIIEADSIRSSASSTDPRRFLFQLKHSFLSGIQTSLPEPAAGLASGILLGVKNALGNFWEQAFRDAGIIHIVVLSGYNLTIVAEFLLRALFFVPYVVRPLFGIGGIFAFVIMVGATAPVVRAGIMASIALLGRATYRRYDVSRAILISAVIMVALNPPILLNDLSFELSFLATLGVVYGTPIVTYFIRFLPERFGLRDVVATTLAAQIAVFPLIVYAIGDVSFVAPFVNAIVLPVVPLAMAFAAIAGLSGVFFPTLSLVVGMPAYVTLSYILAVADISTRFAFSVITLPPFPIFLLVLAYIGIVIAYIRVSFFVEQRKTQ